MTCCDRQENEVLKLKSCTATLLSTDKNAKGLPQEVGIHFSSQGISTATCSISSKPCDVTGNVITMHWAKKQLSTS